VVGDANAVVTKNEEREEVVKGEEEDVDDEGVIVWSAIETVEAKEVDGLAVTRSKAKLEQQKATEEVEKAEEKGKNVMERQPEKARDDRARELPAYRYESKAADAGATKKMYQKMLEAVVPNVTVGDECQQSRLGQPR
jgi:nitrogenase subunit NifH